MSTELLEVPTPQPMPVEETTDAGPRISNQLEKDLLQIFKLLSDETRLRTLLYLAAEEELHVTALCAKLNQSQPAVSHHLALLRVAGLIEARRDGKHNFYSIKQGYLQQFVGELFTSITAPDGDEIRFGNFVLKHADLFSASE